MTTNWYLARNKQKAGPYSMEQLRQFVASRSILAADMLLLEGAPKWVAAGSLPELFGKSAIPEGTGNENDREIKQVEDNLAENPVVRHFAESASGASVRFENRSDLQPNRFYTIYNLADRRQHQRKRELAFHQNGAIGAIVKWYKSKPAPPRGGILVLPTGGGKTFTALYFICSHPLFEGYKVLWLAHTHHLLEQASSYFEDLAGLIAGPKERLTVRVVSGTPEHCQIHAIKSDDDVVICSLQTAANAVKRSHPQLDAFLSAAADKLIVVFDEAHHAPAPSYRALIEHLRSRRPGLFLLGLTATPIYNDERKQGWLLKIFPQNILYQVPAKDLMAAGILCAPCWKTLRPNISRRSTNRRSRIGRRPTATSPKT